MSTPSRPPVERLRSSKRRYLRFVDDYVHGRLDLHQQTDGDPEAVVPTPRGVISAARQALFPQGKRRQNVGAYAAWLWPHRFQAAVVFGLALATAGLEMVEPLFMRFIVDNVLLTSLPLGGAAEPAAPGRRRCSWRWWCCRSLSNVLKDYRQRLLNTQVMLALRRSLFDRLLHLPLPTLWDMKTGGILSRITGDVDTTTGLLQLAVVSPSISVVRLADRGGRAVLAELAAGVDGAGHHPGHHAASASSPRAASGPSTGRCARTSSGSTAASARRSPASASCARSAARRSSCWSSCAAATRCCARSSSPSAARW